MSFVKGRICYPIVVYEERGESPLWIGNFPGLNGCWAEGATKEEVLAAAPGVLHEFASACRELEWPMPEPPTVDELKAANAGEVFMVLESAE